MKNTRAGIYEILLDLVKCPSVSPGSGEVKLAQLLHDKLARLPYFRSFPAHLQLVALEGDPLGRSVVLALARAQPATPRTIILTGHFDVVETKEARALADLAFDPEGYTAKLSSMKLPDDAKKDLESGNYLFGRGVMDMKTGLALQMALLAELSAEPEKMPCNLIFLAVCDEENNSAGMRAAIKRLASLRERRGDLPLLFDFYAGQAARLLGASLPRLSPEARELMQAYGWPGNVRELRLCAERLAQLRPGEEVLVQHLPREIAGVPAVEGETLADQVARLERDAIAQALRRARGKKIRAAALLGISRPTLDKKIAGYRLSVKRGPS